MNTLWINFNRNPIILNSAHVGQGTGRILMENVECLGNETDIATCEFNGWGQTNCSNGDEASVQCITGLASHKKIISIKNDKLISKCF